MIKFFRGPNARKRSGEPFSVRDQTMRRQKILNYDLKQIGKRFLTENQFNKYLLYAIGEIIRVVIGILLALGINYRNEKRKDRSMEEENSLKFIRDGIS